MHPPQTPSPPYRGCQACLAATPHGHPSRRPPRPQLLFLIVDMPFESLQASIFYHIFMGERTLLNMLRSGLRGTQGEVRAEVQGLRMKREMRGDRLDRDKEMEDENRDTDCGTVRVLVFYVRTRTRERTITGARKGGSGTILNNPSPAQVCLKNVLHRKVTSCISLPTPPSSSSSTLPHPPSLTSPHKCTHTRSH